MDARHHARLPGRCCDRGCLPPQCIAYKSLENAVITFDETRVIGKARVLAGLDHGRLDFQRHLMTHGPQPELTRDDYLQLCEAVGLRGRGGAAFPVAMKLKDLPVRGVEAVVVNGSESEPVSRKDRLLLTRSPHLVLDGAVGLAHALRAPHVLIAVHDPEA